MRDASRPSTPRRPPCGDPAYHAAGSPLQRARGRASCTTVTAAGGEGSKELSDYTPDQDTAIYRFSWKTWSMAPNGERSLGPMALHKVIAQPQCQRDDGVRRIRRACGWKHAGTGEIQVVRTEDSTVLVNDS